ncbi:hypothetical protein FN846DRAFT_909421 [Sphaerosporella brunnea]|uniref:MARVEL domain-containing protein n=1 Tax=Sphaerosporella brunnea TaxID=1250544 RepID=A0A5J5EQ30_9PEZI|nr:hypothetical protein FN846DRAFT_909421 [Sphaerosporella brunnea]
MPRPPPGSPTRKEALFGVLLVCVITIFCIFILAAAKIARELKSEIPVFWAILYTTALAILSLLYLTVLVAYYRPLSVHASTFAVNFVLGVAWAIAVVAELMDPNNVFPSRMEHVQKEGRKGESERLFHARVALSGVVGLLLLVMSLVGSMRVLGIIGHSRPRVRGRDSFELEGRDRGNPSSPEPAPRNQNTIRLVLARVGIVKDRSTATTSAVL